jgi:hypothetical protein
MGKADPGRLLSEFDNDAGGLGVGQLSVVK